MGDNGYIAELIGKARKAQREIESYSQGQVDELVRIVGKTVYDNAEELARMAVDESGMGVYEDKVLKNRGKPRIIWNSLKGKKSVGIIGRDDDNSIIYVAKPVGVVAMVTPCTNPIVTPMCNAMFVIKGRNSGIVAPHPRAKKCGKYTIDLINGEFKKAGAPENLLQIIEEPSLDLTNELMRQADVSIATGGMGVVKASYSSGKPSYGVGAGNVQVIIDRDVELKPAAEKIITGRIFDNGIICTGEQCVLAPEELFEDVVEAFRECGAYYCDDELELERFRTTLFTDKRVMNREVVGQSVEKICSLARVNVPGDTRVLLLKAAGPGQEDLLCREKMCPVLAILPYGTFEEAVETAHTNLLEDGIGHTVSIHSNNRNHIEYAGTVLPVSRLIVNQVSSTSSGGSFKNGFAPTTTLGCGTWGNNSISENLTYTHLLNIARIGLCNEDAPVPTDDEIWNS